MADSMETFIGTSIIYTKIAQRGNEVLGVDIDYWSTPTKAGLTVRFVSYAAEGTMQHFKHFHPREEATYQLPGGESAPGTKLDRIQLQLFEGWVPRSVFKTVGDSLVLWVMLADWLKAQAEAEGFVLLDLDMPQVLRSFFPDSASIKLVFDPVKLGILLPTAEDGDSE